MATLNNGTASVQLKKQAGTVLTLNTAKKYVETDIQFNLSVQQAVTSIQTPAADVDVETSGGSGGINIGDILGSRTSSEPESGYYLRMDATGTGNVAVTTPGWIGTGTLAGAPTGATRYFPVNEASFNVAGSNTLSPTAEVSGSNVTLSNVNNGIAVTGTGGGSASAAVTTSSVTAGYVPISGAIAGATVESGLYTTTTTRYISGVNLQRPASGTNSFSITVPNGNSTQTITFTVDSSGNVVIT